MDAIIRHAELDDYEDLHQIYSQTKIIEGTLQLPFPAKQLWKSRLADKPQDFTFLVAELNGEVVGSVSILCKSQTPRRKHAAGIGIAVRENLHRRGIGSQLLLAALDLCDNWLNIHRVELEVFTDNAQAIGFYQKHGFDIEGTLRDYAFKNGRYCDVHAMARIVS